MPDPSVWACKRRRTGNKHAPIIEDEVSALDTVMYTTIGEGKDRRKVLIPVWVDEPQQPAEQAPEPEPHFVPFDGDVDMLETSARPRDRSFYMKEFVSRSGDILQALQDTEALPNPDTCAECADPAGYWRCKDCFGGRRLCRGCIRLSHFVNPFHRIEHWTGTYFRKAALWEVGVYLLLRHHNAPSICANLNWQRKILENFQQRKDTLQTGSAAHDTDPGGPDDEYPHPPAGSSMVEEEDEEFLDAEDDIQDTDAGQQGFVDYMQVDDRNQEPAHRLTHSH